MENSPPRVTIARDPAAMSSGSAAILLALLPHAALADCEAWCMEPCAVLNGDVRQSPHFKTICIRCYSSVCRFFFPQVRHECNDCPADFLCRPGADGYGSWKERVVTASVDARSGTGTNDNGIANSAALPANAAADGITSEEAVACQYVNAADLEGIGPAVLATVFSRPTVIRNLIDHWPAHELWANASGFAQAFGAHRVLARRANFARERCATSGDDPSVVTVPLRDFEPHLDREHIVVYNGEGGMVASEHRLLGALRSSQAYDVPSVLMRASGTQVFSFGGGHGVRMGNHGFAWIGLVAGVKHWYVAPGSSPKPENPTCYDRRKVERIAGVTHCEQRAKEVIIVPTAWWHATCNLEDYTFGVGGQDSCDLVDCPGYEHADHMNRKFCWTGAQESRRCFKAEHVEHILGRALAAERQADAELEVSKFH